MVKGRDTVGDIRGSNQGGGGADQGMELEKNEKGKKSKSYRKSCARLRGQHWYNKGRKRQDIEVCSDVVALGNVLSIPCRSVIVVLSGLGRPEEAEKTVAVPWESRLHDPRQERRLPVLVRHMTDDGSRRR